jgi:3-hydroxyacyl-CoA dehydrogenase
MLAKTIPYADWVIEAVAEDGNIKRQMYAKIEPYLQPNVIISTTTSSLPLDSLTEGRSKIFRKNFLSTHFYNPPGKMFACEIAATDSTDKGIYNFMKDFLHQRLGRVVVPTKNLEGFAGNRIAFLLFNKITQLALEYGTEMMDYLIGPYTGRLMPPLATIDLVGLDIHKAIVNSLHINTNDEMHDFFVLPAFIDMMIKNGLLGNKAGSGFYKKLEGGRILYYDPASGDYIPAVQPHLVFVEQAKHLIRLGMYREAFEIVKNAHEKEADIVRDILYTYVAYSYNRIGEVTDEQFGIDGIDSVMSSGFHWACPSLMLNLLGGAEETAEKMLELGLKVPDRLYNKTDTMLQILDSGKYFVAL